MTQSVTEKTDIPEKTWRRQPDSPTWWIAFSCGSVILHILAFWLISLYEFKSSQQRISQSAVAIEFIEVSPQKSSPVQPKPKPKPKPVSPKALNTPTNQAIKPIVPLLSQPPTNPSAVKPPVSTKKDRNAIAFNNQKIEEQLQQQRDLAEQLRQQKLAIQQQRELAQQRQRLEAQQRQRLEAQQRQRLEAQQRQRLEAQQRQRLEAQQRQRLEAQQRQRLEAQQRQRLEAQQRQRLEAQQRQRLEAQQRQRLEAEQRQRLEAEQRQRLEAQQRQRLEAQQRQRLEAQQEPGNPADGETINDAIANKVGQAPKQPKINSQTPDSPIQNNQNEDIPLNQSDQTQLNQSSGILTASWDIDSNRPITRDIPANPPQPKENISKSFVIPASEKNNLASANFQVYLQINEEGTVEFTRVDENIPTEKRNLYQAYVDKEFLNQKLFIPATDPDPRTGELKPRRGELFIRIKIQRGY